MLGECLVAMEANQEIPPKPQDTAGLDPELRGVLALYYQNSLGGEAHWDSVETMLIEGRVELPGGDVLFFKNYRKKPDLNKTILYLPGDYKVIQSFDGKIAWECLTFESEDPKQMPEKQASDSIRDACFGSHLLYPLIPGKKIEYLGNPIVNEKKISLIQVTLPNSQLIKIGLNASGYQVSEETIQLMDGKKRKTLQYDFRKISGITVPFRTQTLIDDERVQEVRIDSVIINKGVYTWMFGRTLNADS